MDSAPPTDPSPPAVVPLAGTAADAPADKSLPANPPTRAGEGDAVRYESSKDSTATTQQAADDEPIRYAIGLPLTLFVLSCLSLFITGCCRWMPLTVFDECIPPIPEFHWWTLSFTSEFAWDKIDFTPLRLAILTEWRTGLLYTVSVLSILLAHEFGHFLMTVVYRVWATLPLVVPFPLSPFGTLGAVIAMEPGKANRPQIFDIGIAGPLAGLVIAIPMLWLGIQHIDFSQPPGGELAIRPPLLMEWMLQWLRPTEWQNAGGEIWLSQTNPMLFSGWMGLFFTGLNMFPVGQLDGGHITYTLMGRGAHFLARALMVTAFAYMSYTSNTMLLLMAVLVMLMGTDHPPTADDRVPLGWPRIVLGWVSLIIPIICLTPEPLRLA